MKAGLGAPIVAGNLCAALAAAALEGCAVGESCAPRLLPAPEALRSASDTVRIAGRPLVLRADLWRDFMPVQASPEGSCLYAVFTVATSDSGALPGDVSASIGWGPRWGPGVSVDAVAQLKDAQGRSWLLRAPDQPVRRTD